MTTDNEKHEAALATLAAAQEKTDRLQSAYDSLEARVNKYTADLAEALETAQAAEQAAADQVAAAIASGEDDSVIRKAEEQLTQASEKTHAATQAATGGAVLAALKAQLESLTAPLDEARKSQASAQLAANALRRAILQDAWKKGIYALIDDVGIELSTLCVDEGFWDLRKMQIPLFRDSRFIDGHEVRERRTGRATVVSSTTLPPLNPKTPTIQKDQPATECQDVLVYSNEDDTSDNAPTASVKQIITPRASSERSMRPTIMGTGRANQHTQ